MKIRLEVLGEEPIDEFQEASGISTTWVWCTSRGIHTRTSHHYLGRGQLRTKAQIIDTQVLLVLWIYAVKLEDAYVARFARGGISNVHGFSSVLSSASATSGR